MGTRFYAPVQNGPGAQPPSCTMGTRYFPGVKSDQGVTLTPHPLLVPWSRNGRAIPLLPLWAVRLVQSLSACTRVHFIFIFSINMRQVRLCFITYCIHSMRSHLYIYIYIYIYIYTHTHTHTHIAYNC